MSIEYSNIDIEHKMEQFDKSFISANSRQTHPYERYKEQSYVHLIMDEIKTTTDVEQSL